MATRLVRFFAVCVLLATSISLADSEILVAVAGPLSVQKIAIGEQAQQGARMAVADLNASGGVLGRQLHLLVGDDSCDSAQAVAVARKLVAEGVVFVVGHVCSHASIPASKVYQDAGVVMISPASTNPLLTDQGGDNIFRVVGRDDYQGIVAGNYLAENWGSKNIAILHDNSTYGKGLADETRKQVNKRGVKEKLYLQYEPGQCDYSQPVSEIASKSIDVVYLGGYASDAGLILREAYDQGLEIHLVGGDSLTTEEFWMTAGPAAEGTLVTFGPDPRESPGATEITARFREQGFEPEGYTLYAYGALQVWSQAVEKAGTLELKAVVSALHNHQFNTVLGEIGFDEKGDLKAPEYVWYRWTDGQYVPVK